LEVQEPDVDNNELQYTRTRVPHGGIKNEMETEMLVQNTYKNG
jgi:hypothetical protein